MRTCECFQSHGEYYVSALTGRCRRVRLIPPCSWRSGSSPEGRLRPPPTSRPLLHCPLSLPHPAPAQAFSSLVLSLLSAPALPSVYTGLAEEPLFCFQGSSSLVCKITFLASCGTSAGLSDSSRLCLFPSFLLSPFLGISSLRAGRSSLFPSDVFP